jgi:hypothetical protein
MSGFSNVTASELLTTVSSILTHIPKKELKQYFVRHVALSSEIRTVAADFNTLWSAFRVFQKRLPEILADDEQLQRVIVQLACVSAVLGKLDPDNDEYGLYAGCALFVSEWCAYLGLRLFPKCHPLSFYALWSPFLRILGVPWAYHGATSVVLVSLAQNVEMEDDEPYSLVFPGPAPNMTSSNTSEKDSWFESWSTRDSPALRQLVGFSSRVASRQVQYFNPADSSWQLHRKYDSIWAYDLLAQPPEVAEFEKDDDNAQETDEAFAADLSKLRTLLESTAVDAPESKKQAETKVEPEKNTAKTAK